MYPLCLFENMYISARYQSDGYQIYDQREKKIYLKATEPQTKKLEGKNNATIWSK